MTDDWPTALEAMTPDPITIDSEETLSTALGLMRTHGIHELPVTTRGKLAGLLPYDAIGRRHKISLTTKVLHLMSVAPTVPPRATLPEVAERLLASESRAACVVDPRQGRLLGIVSSTDIVKAAGGIPEISSQTVRQLLNPISNIFHEKDTCASIISIAGNLDHHPAAIVDSKNRLIGAVGLDEIGDALWRPVQKGHRDIGETQAASGALIRSIMRSSPPTVEETALLRDAIRLMNRFRANSVFVVDAQQPIGVISHGDILSFVVSQRKTVEGAYVQISGLGPATDPYLLSDLDRVIGRGLKRIAHLEKPVMLSVHVAPHKSHRIADVTLQGRLYTENSGSYHATRTDWSLQATVAALMDELERQVRQIKSYSKSKKQQVSLRKAPPSGSDILAGADIEERIRSMSSPPPRAPRRAPAKRR
ncbi:MAG: CBS domain-containing protein [Candidatus Thermoplasmatota archaeon]|jgi:CBS domain-containing protein|nr:CBS domain-containing protein [Candidatus Thermoplasmatota archaeon]